MKRFLDLASVSIGLLLVAPILLLVVLVILLKLGKPIFFKQKRPGLNGNPFMMHKFRTMTNETDEKGNLLPNDQRLTRFGKFLRSTSLDELPELINVLKGDMSLVGPRPLLMEYLLLYNEQQARRHEVKPGITGWAQVNGRNAISWEQKFDYDVWYVENQSLWLDIKILFITVLKVFNRDGIAHKGDVAMPRFKGNQETGTQDT